MHKEATSQGFITMYYYSNFRPLIKYCNGYKKKNQHWEVLFSCRHFSTARKKWIYIGFCYPTLTELLCKYTHYTLFHIRSWKKEKKQRQGRNEGAVVTTMETVS